MLILSRKENWLERALELKDERKFWIMLLSLNVTLSLLLLRFPICLSFLERKIGWKEELGASMLWVTPGSTMLWVKTFSFSYFFEVTNRRIGSFRFWKIQ